VYYKPIVYHVKNWKLKVDCRWLSSSEVFDLVLQGFVILHGRPVSGNICERSVSGRVKSANRDATRSVRFI
jgi:hypothetical protein